MFLFSKMAYWLLLSFAVLLLMALLVGQSGSLINYQYTVRLGLQESVAIIGSFGVAMNKGFATADTIVYVPLVICAILGFIRKKVWGLACMLGVMALTAYWPIVCLVTLYNARGSRGFHFDNFLAYTILLSVIFVIGVCGFIYLCRVLAKLRVVTNCSAR